MNYVLTVQVCSFFALGILFLIAGDLKFGLAQLLFGAGTLSIYFP
jgi:hypothetical protein